MKNLMLSVLTITLFVSIVIFNFSHKSVSQVDLDNMFGGGICPGTLSCNEERPSDPANGDTYCSGGDYTACVDAPNSPNGTCNTSYDNTDPAHCGKKYQYNAQTGSWLQVVPNSHCILVPNGVNGSGCAG